MCLHPSASDHPGCIGRAFPADHQKSWTPWPVMCIRHPKPLLPEKKQGERYGKTKERFVCAS